MRVLLAFDKFKDAVSADTACTIARESLREIHPLWQIDAAPLTDGGEGFAEILTRSANGQLYSSTVTGPRGTPVSAPYGLVPLAHIPARARLQLALPENTPADASVAIVEMAAASGLALLSPSQRDPWHTTSFGTGELIVAAAQAGAAAILLGVGGSATNDLGLGTLAALGLSFESATREILSPPTPATWARLTELRGEIPSGFPPIRIACDVTNPLLGATGCAATFGPQKGLHPSDLARIEQASAHVSDLLLGYFDRPRSLLNTPGAGAAGGIAFGLMCAARAKLLPGFALVSSWLDLDARIAAADLVITGEGRFDATSLDGKGPGAIVARARSLGKCIHVFAGAIDAPVSLGASLHAITPPGLPLADALRSTRTLLASAISTTFR